MSGCRGAPRGFALVTVLWAVTLLMVMGAAFAFSMRTETRMAANFVSRAQAEAVAEAGIQRAILEILSSRGEPAWASTGGAYEFEFDNAKLRVVVTSEQGKIDLNGAPEALIKGLLRATADAMPELDEPTANALADAILDWRDPDQRRRPHGAEDSAYRAQGRELGARDGAFLAVSELNQILDMPKEVAVRLARSTTVYSWMPQVDPNTATRDALLAIPGLDAASVDEFIEARERIYSEPSPEGGAAAQRLPLQLLASGARYLSRARSSTHSVAATAVMPDGARAWRRAVIRLSGDARQPYLFLAWFDVDYDDSKADSAPAGDAEK